MHLKFKKLSGFILASEGMSISNGNTLFVIVSHSLRRLRIKDGNTYLKNIKTITKVIQEDKKNRIYKLSLDLQSATIKAKIETIHIKQVIVINDNVPNGAATLFEIRNPTQQE